MGTGHEMAARLWEGSGYIKGAKYKKQKSWYSFDFSQYEPNIVPHKKSKKYKEVLKNKEEASKKAAEKASRKKEIKQKERARKEEAEAKAEASGKKKKTKKKKSPTENSEEKATGDDGKKGSKKKLKRKPDRAAKGMKKTQQTASAEHTSDGGSAKKKQ